MGRGRKSPGGFTETTRHPFRRWKLTRKTAADVFALLETELPELKAQIAALEIQVIAAKDSSEQNNRALRGSNNNPGLVADVSTLCTSQNEMNERVEAIETCLHKGTDGVPGLVDQVRENREWRKSLKYWYVLFVGAILVGLVELGSRYLFPPIP